MLYLLDYRVVPSCLQNLLLQALGVELLLVAGEEVLHPLVILEAVDSGLEVLLDGERLQEGTPAAASPLVEGIEVLQGKGVGLQVGVHLQ